jgi:hypothetical protein
MDLFPTDILVLAVITQLVSHAPQSPISYMDIARNLAIPTSRLTVVKSVCRLEAKSHLRRVGGLTHKGYRYELSTTVKLAIAVCE